MSAFFFFVQRSSFTQSNSVRPVLGIFSSVFRFYNTKGCCYEKHNFSRFRVQNPASRMLQIDQKSEKWQWRHNFPIWRQQYFNMTSTIFWLCFVSPAKFSYWSNFHVNIITGSGIMTIFFYKGLARNSEIGKTTVWVLPNI